MVVKSRDETSIDIIQREQCNAIIIEANQWSNAPCMRIREALYVPDDDIGTPARKGKRINVYYI
jgi:hypothetical protein